MSRTVSAGDGGRRRSLAGLLGGFAAVVGVGLAIVGGIEALAILTGGPVEPAALVGCGALVVAGGALVRFGFARWTISERG